MGGKILKDMETGINDRHLNREMFVNGGEWKLERDKTTECFTLIGRADTLKVFHTFIDWTGHKTSQFVIYGRNGWDRLTVTTVDGLITAAQLMGYEECVMEKLMQLKNKQ